MPGTIRVNLLVSERVIDRWNRLQQEDIDVKTVNSFKTVLERKRQRMGFFIIIIIIYGLMVRLALWPRMF